MREIDAALDFANHNHNVYWNAQLLTLKGDCLRQVSARGAENAYRLALAVARKQGARLLALRALIGLCRLQLPQGVRQRAWRQLADAYAGFDEGFASADLSLARQCLHSSRHVTNLAHDADAL